MIYLGIEPNRSGFNTTALSETFAIIGENQFYFSQPIDYLDWLEQLKTAPTEPVQVFIETIELAANCPNYIFAGNNDFYSVFSVNNRALSNLIHFLGECFARQNLAAAQLARSWVLASARRIFEPHLLKPVTPFKKEPF
jgi:hypothetical protein